jgi:transposase
MTREEATALLYENPEAAVELIQQLVATVERLTARVEELERKNALLTTDSSNSSKPPSSDGPQTKLRPRPAQKSRKRKPGGQPGHKGTKRALIPTEQAKEVIPVFPDACCHCGAVLEPEPAPDKPTGKYWRHQVIDIPEPKPEFTEYHLHCIRCSCGTENWAKIPKEARSGFGPRVTALLAHLTGLHRVTRRGCQEIAKTIFGIDICFGSVCKLHQDVSESLAAAHEDVRQALAKEPVLNIDETGWNTLGLACWLWALVTPSIAFYHIAKSRGSKVLRELLGDEYKGILCSDMYSAYKAFHHGVRQFCWAHIIRGIRGIKHACRSPDAVRFSKLMLAEIGRMFALWHAFKKGHLDRQTLVKKSLPIRSRMKKCLNLHLSSSDYHVRKTAKSLLKHWDGLFTFLEHEGVEPTNNSAERAVRPAVQWIKICFGNQSEEGEILTARLLTAERSCILQGRNPYKFIVDSVTAYRNGLPGPTWIPASC